MCLELGHLILLFLLTHDFSCYMGSLLLLEHITRNSGLYNTSPFSSSSGGQKSELSSAGPMSRCWQSWDFLKALRGQFDSLAFLSFQWLPVFFGL